MVILKLLVFYVCIAALPMVAHSQGLITPEQAADAVRAFESNSSLGFVRNELKEDNELPEWASRSSYCLSATGDEVSWDVDARTGEVTFMHDESTYTGGESDTPFGPLSQEQCQQIALNYARAKYAGFDTMLNNTRPGEWAITGWEFGWCKELPCGALTPDSVEVCVSPVDGRIESYSSVRIAPFTSPVPAVTSEQAVSLACVAAGITDLTDLDGPFLAANPDEITWEMELGGAGEPDEDLGNHYLASVNAVTGNVQGLYPGDENVPSVLPKAAKSKQSARQPKAKLRVWIRLLAKQVQGASVQWLGKQGAKLTVGADVYELIPGRSVAMSKSGPVILDSPLVVREGMLMVPLKMLVILKGTAQLD